MSDQIKKATRRAESEVDKGEQRTAMSDQKKQATPRAESEVDKGDQRTAASATLEKDRNELSEKEEKQYESEEVDVLKCSQ